MRGGLAAIVAAALLLSACTGSSQPEPETAATTDGSEPNPPVTEATTRPPVSPLPWQVVKKWPRGPKDPWGEYNTGYEAYWDSSGPDTRGVETLTVLDHRGRLVLTRRKNSPDWFTQEVWLTGHFAVVEDLNLDERLVRLFVYDLHSGSQIPMPHGLQPTQPEVDAGFGKVTFTTGHSKTRMCQQLVGLDSGIVEPPVCESTGDVLGDAAIGPDSYLYSRVRNPERPPARCKHVFVVADAVKMGVPQRDSCLGWSGALIAGAVAWDEADPYSEMLAVAQGFVLIEDRVEGLGEVDTDSIVGCGDRFFWTAEDGRGERIDAWSKNHGVTTVWPPHRNAGPAALECSDGRWLHTRVDDIDGKNEHLRFMVLDTRGS